MAPSVLPLRRLTVVAVCWTMLHFTACGSPSPITISLSNASYATTGFNLFNCGSPAQPAVPRGLSTGGIECDPAMVANGVYAPATATYGLACDDDNAAVLVVSCAASDGGSGNTLSGFVALGINPNCSPTDGGLPMHAQVFEFSLAPGASQSQTMRSCANFDDVCPSNDPCAFNALSAQVQVTNSLQP
jgi:hypothetical protein